MLDGRTEPLSLDNAAEALGTSRRTMTRVAADGREAGIVQAGSLGLLPAGAKLPPVEGDDLAHRVAQAVEAASSYPVSRPAVAATAGISVSSPKLTAAIATAEERGDIRAVRGGAPTQRGFYAPALSRAA